MKEREKKQVNKSIHKSIPDGTFARGYADKSFREVKKKKLYTKLALASAALDGKVLPFLLAAVTDHFSAIYSTHFDVSFYHFQ